MCENEKPPFCSQLEQSEKSLEYQHKLLSKITRFRKMVPLKDELRITFNTVYRLLESSSDAEILEIAFYNKLRFEKALDKAELRELGKVKNEADKTSS